MKLSRDQFIYKLALVLTSFYTVVIYSSYVREFIPRLIIVALLIGIIGLLTISICMNKWAKKIVIPLFLVAIVFVICWSESEKNILLVYLFMIIASYKKSLRDVQRTIAIATIIFTIFVIGLSLLGIVQNDIYEHGEKTAYCLGFFYYSSVSYNIYFSSTLLMCINEYIGGKKKQIFNIVVYYIVNYITYRVCTARLTLIFTVFTIVAYLYIYKRKVIHVTKKKIILIASAFPISAILNYLVAFYYTPSNKIFLTINELLRSRLVLSQQGITKYGISLFGSKIENINDVINGNSVYFYIDNGYINTLLSYGIIFFVIIMLSYSIIAVYSYKHNEKTLLLLCIVVCLFSFINNVIISVSLNPVLLMVPNVLYAISKEKRK